MAYGFYPFVGWATFWVAFIAGIILFIKYRKLYNIFYLVSIALYIFTTSFMIDVFEFGKFGILTTLIISAILFMLLGFYLSKVLHDEPDK
tara:strand:- start:366 stop:635 length:270 start_codon:yes stop_codon:yes gene_type:complete